MRWSSPGFRFARSLAGLCKFSQSQLFGPAGSFWIEQSFRAHLIGVTHDTKDAIMGTLLICELNHTVWFLQQREYKRCSSTELNTLIPVSTMIKVRNRPESESTCSERRILLGTNREIRVIRTNGLVL